MYHHVKKLMYTVNVGEPDPRFGTMLLEQFGGANGELAAAMQYSIQGINCEDPPDQRSADGHRHGGAEPPGGHRRAGPDAPQADEERSRGRRGRSSDRHRRRRRGRAVQFARATPGPPTT